MQELAHAEKVSNQIENTKLTMAEIVKRIVTIGRKLSRHGASVETSYDDDDGAMQTLRFSVSYLEDPAKDTIVVRINDEEKPRFHLMFGAGKIHVKKVDCRELPEQYLCMAAGCLETLAAKMAQAVEKKAARATEAAAILERVKNSSLFSANEDEAG